MGRSLWVLTLLLLVPTLAVAQSNSSASLRETVREQIRTRIEAERNFSSGCIRVEQPMKLAEYLLSNQPQWSPQRIQSVLTTSTAEQSVSLRPRVPVHLQYWTAWADTDGTMHFRNDAYQRDGAVRNALTTAPPTE